MPGIRTIALALVAALGATQGANPDLSATPELQVPPGKLLVANQQAASASIVDLATGEVTHFEVGVGPHETAISADGKWGVVSIYGQQSPGNKLAVVDMEQKKVVRTIDLGEYTRPHGLTAVAGKPFRVVATSETTQNLVLVDVENGTVVAATPTGARGSHVAAVTTDAKRAFTANVHDGTMSAVDLDARRTLGTVNIAPRSEGIAATPNGSEAWVGSNEAGTVTIVNGTSLKVDTVLSGFGVPYRLAITPDSRTAVVVEAGANQVRFVDVKTRNILGAVAVGGSPRGVFVSPDSKTAFVTLGPQGEVVVVDIQSRQVLARHKVGAAPDGVAYGK